MSLPVSIFELVIAIAALALTSHFFVGNAIIFSERTGRSKVFTGVVVIGFGTSLPELATAVFASVAHHPSVGVASSLGATVINLTVVAGITAVTAMPKISSRTLRNEGLVSAIGAGIFVAGFVVLHLTFLFALIPLGVFVVATLLIVRGSGVDPIYEGEVPEESSSKSLFVVGALCLGGLVGTLLAAQVFLDAALNIANFAGMSKVVAGAVIVSFGTALPEIASAVQAAIKRAPDLAIGNALGSSFFNSLVAAPAAVLFDPQGKLGGVSFTSFFAVACSIVLYLLMWSGHRLSRSEGVVLLTLYLVFLGYSFLG